MALDDEGKLREFSEAAIAYAQDIISYADRLEDILADVISLHEDHKTKDYLPRASKDKVTAGMLNVAEEYSALHKRREELIQRGEDISTEYKELF